MRSSRHLGSGALTGSVRATARSWRPPLRSSKSPRAAAFGWSEPSRGHNRRAKLSISPCVATTPSSRISFANDSLHSCSDTTLPHLPGQQAPSSKLADRGHRVARRPYDKLLTAAAIQASSAEIVIASPWRPVTHALPFQSVEPGADKRRAGGTTTKRARRLVYSSRSSSANLFLLFLRLRSTFRSIHSKRRSPAVGRRFVSR